MIRRAVTGRLASGELVAKPTPPSISPLERKVSPLFKKLALFGAAVAFVGGTFGVSPLAGADELAPSEPAVEVAPVASTTVGITLVAADDPNWNGDNDLDKLCNLKNGFNQPGHFLQASVSSGDTAVATVSPSIIDFTDCGQTQNITITGVACGSTNVSITYFDSRHAGGGNAVFSDGTVAVTVSGCGGPVTGIDNCAAPAAPAWAAAILQVNGIKGSNKAYSGLISSVAHAMLQGAAFPSGDSVVSKADQGAYSAAVYAYMLANKPANMNLAKGPADAKTIRPGWSCEHHAAV